MTLYFLYGAIKLAQKHSGTLRKGREGRKETKGRKHSHRGWAMTLRITLAMRRSVSCGEAGKGIGGKGKSTDKAGEAQRVWCNLRRG